MKTALIISGTAFALLLSIVIVFMLSASRVCATEDSNMCYWNGGDNGQGITYVTIFDHPIPFSL